MQATRTPARSASVSPITLSILVTRPRFISLRVQITGLTVLATALVAVAMYAATDEVLKSMLDRDRAVVAQRLSDVLGGIYAQWIRHAEDLTGIVASVDDIAHGAFESNGGMVRRALDSMLPTLEVGTGATFVRVYDARGRPLAAAKDQITSHRELDRLVADNASKIEPLHLLACAESCIQYAAVPVLYHGVPAGWVATGYPLSDMFVTFGQVSRAAIRIQRASVPTPAHAVRLAPPQIPLPATHRLYAVFDPRPEAALIESFRATMIAIGMTALLLLAGGIWFMLYRHGQRFEHIVRALPLLATEPFEGFRRRAEPPPRSVSDELDVLANALVSLSHRIQESREHEKHAIEERAARAAAEAAAAEKAVFIDRVTRDAEVERGAMARELHDELGQCLAGLRLSIASIRQDTPAALEGVHGCIAAMDKDIQQANRELKRIIGSLRPEVLDALGIHKAIRGLVDEWRTRMPGCVIDLDIDGRVATLDDPLQVAAYRIVQEAITNVAKHADATHCTVRIRIEEQPTASGVARGGRQVRIEVTDDGQGFDGGFTASGTGLRGMQDRAFAFGGVCSVTSAPGRGTTILVNLPAATSRS